MLAMQTFMSHSNAITQRCGNRDKSDAYQTDSEDILMVSTHTIHTLF